jgi:phytoene dehydrogenase-like protein
VDEQMGDVVVIGAGMSGLMAATTLAGKADVVVLEAEDRPGGRVETVRKGDYLFSRDLLSVYPQLEGKLGDGIVRRHHRVVPFWGPRGRESLPTLRNPLGPIYLAGDYQLDMPSLADAATSGENTAKAVLSSLDR